MFSKSQNCIVSKKLFIHEILLSLTNYYSPFHRPLVVDMTQSRQELYAPADLITHCQVLYLYVRIAVDVESLLLAPFPLCRTVPCPQVNDLQTWIKVWVNLHRSNSPSPNTEKNEWEKLICLRFLPITITGMLTL